MMNADDIRKLLKAEPFEPFDIGLADGRVIPVPHPEFAWAPPSQRRLVFAVAPEDGRGRMVNTTVITSIETRGGSAGDPPAPSNGGS